MYLIYRSWGEGVLGKSVRRFPEPAVLDWFRSTWATPEAVHDLGVHGLGHIPGEGGPPPADMAGLRTLARSRLSDSHQCNVDDHSLRGLANGLDHEVAYYLLDDAVAEAEPRRWAYAVHDGPLPDGSGDAPFDPPCPVTHLGPLSSGDGTVYAIFMECVAKHDSIGRHRPYALTGVRLPELGAALREAVPDGDTWPRELEVLRAMVAPGETGIGPALRRCNDWPDFLDSETDGHTGSHEAALRLTAARPPAPSLHRERTVVHVGEHLAQLFLSGWNDTYGQWFLFDDRWAGAHPDLAASLTWFAAHWDPACARPHSRLTTCADNRVRYVAVAGPDGRPVVRLAGPQDEDGLGDLWSSDRPAPAQRVLATVELQLRQPAPDTWKLTHYSVDPHRQGRLTAGLLAQRIAADLRAEGITQATGWLPDDRAHGKLFLRVLGDLGRRRPD